MTVADVDARALEPFEVEFNGDLHVGRFMAMASPCEILVDDHDEELARRLVAIAQAEAQRIERRFSRYRDDNIVWEINHAGGRPVTVDDETAHLLDFADECHRISGGMFDITSGCLRRAWTFDGSDRVPESDAIAAALTSVGWGKVQWARPTLRMQAGMEIDFGGVGKEYAVDRALLLIRQASSVPVLVNFGGDLAVSGPREAKRKWSVGIENPDGGSTREEADTTLEISVGALATSGDSRRYVMREGVRYGHVLDPFTGWPIPDAPLSVTVAASNCVTAGMLATFGLLEGINAEQFLREQGVSFWCLR